MTDQRFDPGGGAGRGADAGSLPPTGSPGDHPLVISPVGGPTAAATGAARFGVVLLLLLATFIVLAAAPTGPWATVLGTVLQATTLIAALHAAHSRPFLRRLALAVGVLSVTGSVIEAALGTPDQRGAYFLVDVLLVGGAPGAILAGILRRRVLDVQTVMGALCIYVLLGMLWAFLYAGIGAVESAPFFAQTARADTSDFMYFSFVTLTTTGYGDLTAAGSLGRAVAVLEALFGQLYLVTVVALLVGNLAPRRRT